jgi:hypothetical protein
MVEGSMLRNPGRQFLRGVPPIWSGNQVVFYGSRAAALFDAALQGGL